MKILLVHPVLLPPRDYGGVERVVLWLTQGLVECGHEVYVAAAPGSQLPEGSHLIEVRNNFQVEDWLRILPKGLDVVHLMAPMGESLWSAWPVPAVLTVHGNGQIGEKFPHNSVFLSRDHARRHGAKNYVYNGINPSEYLFDPASKKDWNLFLSKTSWSVKNVRGAARWSRIAQRPLRIAGGNRPWLLRLQCQFSRALEWVGPVAGLRKAELLASARALLFPVKWPEPFGLVVAEALISGTPVIANPRGSLTELIPPHVGALPSSDEEWLELLRSSKTIAPPEVCRAWALEQFHYLGMAKNYEKIYKKVIGGEMLQETQPMTLDISENRDWRT